MIQERPSENIRIAFIPTERDWIINLRSLANFDSSIALGPVSVDLAVLEMAEIVIFDVTAPAQLLDWLEESNKIGIQLVDPGDRVLSVSYFYLPSSIQPEVLLKRIVSAYQNRFGDRRLVGVLGTVGGCGLSEIAISLCNEWSLNGSSTLLAEVSGKPGDIAVRLGMNKTCGPEDTGFVPIGPNANAWICTIENKSLEDIAFESYLNSFAVDLVVCDLGTEITLGVSARLDDLIIVTRPSPSGLRRTLKLARQFPGSVIVINGQISDISQMAIRYISRAFPGQVHRLPWVETADRCNWEGVPFRDTVWRRAIRSLLPERPGLLRMAA